MATKKRPPPRATAMVRLDGALRFNPRTRLKPIGQAIQHALLRVDPGDTRTRLEKLGEMAVKRALNGEEAWARWIGDRFEGKVMPHDDEGGDDNLSGVLLSSLVEALIDRKLGNSAKVVEVNTRDVIGELVAKKTQE